AVRSAAPDPGLASAVRSPNSTIREETAPMRSFIEVRTADSRALFDVDEVPTGGPERVSRPDGAAVVVKLRESLDESLASVLPAAEAVINAFRTLSPHTTEVEFGVRLDAEAGAVFAKAGVGAHFTVTLSWDRPRGLRETHSPSTQRPRT